MGEVSPQRHDSAARERRQGDDRPLDWVERFLKEHPEKIDVIANAYVELLRDPDASRRAQILEQLPTFPIDLTATSDDRWPEFARRLRLGN